MKTPYMTKYDEKNRFVRIIKAVFLFLGVPLGLLGICAFLTTGYGLVKMSALVSILAISISISLVVYQKRISIQTVLILVFGLIFLASSVINMYGYTLEFHPKVLLNEISVGIINIGVGIINFTFATGLLDSNKFGATSSKYRRLLIVLFIMSIISFAVGIFVVHDGIQSWNTFVQ